MAGHEGVRLNETQTISKFFVDEEEDDEDSFPPFHVTRLAIRRGDKRPGTAWHRCGPCSRNFSKTKTHTYGDTMHAYVYPRDFAFC